MDRKQLQKDAAKFRQLLLTSMLETLATFRQDFGKNEAMPRNV